MHLLMRQFLQKIAQIDKSVTSEYEIGEQEFIGYFLRKLKKIGQLSEKRYKKAMKRKNEDAANFQELLKLLPKQKRGVDTDEWRVISSTVELFYSTKERLKFFKAQRKLEYESHNFLQFVEMSAYEGLQMSRINYRYEEILPLLEAAEQELLKTKKPEETSNQMSLTTKFFREKVEKYFAAKHVNSLTDAEKEKLNLLYQLWGNVCTTCLKDIDKAVERIKIAYDLLKELKLKNTNTARFYSTMADLILNKSRLQQGNALVEKSKIKEALGFYQKAYELRRDLTQSEHHPDIPVYLANIGSCHYQLEEGENAIEYYRRSLRVEDEMVIDNEKGYLKTLRNLALALRDVDKYEDAIDFGERCASRRMELLGIHTDTARTYYLLGLFYYERDHRGDMRSAEENFNEALKIEEQLWKQGKPHSVDWENLKKRIQMVLARTEQKMKYPAYKRRFDNAERKSTQEPKETVILSDDDPEVDSSDDFVDEVKVEQMEESNLKSKCHDSNSSDSDEGDTRSVVSKYNCISSLALFKGQGDKFNKPKTARKENLHS
ncbi:uncharacterized protein [Antedon mediterranea]|uniref:uncharacterized protein n=1 Tax=Antedon mediterranea TaxID=105859 RepID=UPI003AF8316C